MLCVVAMTTDAEIGMSPPDATDTRLLGVQFQVLPHGHTPARRLEPVQSYLQPAPMRDGAGNAVASDKHKDRRWQRWSSRKCVVCLPGCPALC